MLFHFDDAIKSLVFQLMWTLLKDDMNDQKFIEQYEAYIEAF